MEASVIDRADANQPRHSVNAVRRAIGSIRLERAI
jgi:hypothetical protein